MNDPTSELRLLDAILRNDLVAFVQRCFKELYPGKKFEPTWHHDAMAYVLDVTAVKAEYPRAIINLPPRSLKSEIASIALPAFILGRDPTRQLIVISYNQELAADFGRKTRQIMQSGWYQRLFPSTRIHGKGAETALYTTSGGFRRGTSVEGTLTGRGGDTIIVDDPQKAADAFSAVRRESLYQWVTQTMFTRLDDKRTGSIVLVQQRLHDDDLSGRLLETGDWLHLNLPAIATKDETICLGRSPLRFHDRRVGDLLDPVREPLSVLNRLRTDMGAALFEAQYQQTPLPPDGAVIKLGWFKRYETLPAYDRVILSVDTASKAGQHNDYSVITFWYVREDRYYLDYVWRERVEYPELKRLVDGFADGMGAETVIIEDKGAGIGLIQDLQETSPNYEVVAFDPGTLDKETRMRIQSAKIENGRVWLPENRPFLDAFLDEVRRFPSAPHDDQIDSVSQFLAWITAPPKTGDLLILR